MRKYVPSNRDRIVPVILSIVARNFNVQIVINAVQVAAEDHREIDIATIFRIETLSIAAFRQPSDELRTFDRVVGTRVKSDFQRTRVIADGAPERIAFR